VAEEYDVNVSIEGLSSSNDVNDIASRRYQLLIRIARELLVLEDELSYLDEAFKIAIENGLTVYDSLYIA
jgi:predicted nucleic acid-binding protein